MRQEQGRAARKAMIVAVAAAYFAATGGASLHLATEAHTLCAAHGELVHVGHDGAPPQALVPADRKAADPNGALRTGSDAPDHDHCSLASHRAGTAATIDRVPGLVIRASATPVRSVPTAEPVPPGRAVTDVAPKQSPPAA